MYTYQNNKVGLRIGICCIIIVMIAVSSTQAADRSRILTIGLFTSGVALKFGSVFVANSAQDTYDQYLSTGIQSDLAKHRDDYETQRSLSIGMSRTGIGFVGLAVLISIFDQLDVISESPPSRSGQLSFNPSYNPRTGEAALTLQRKF
ncbi:hypothetical protein J4G02_02105 [Candidatus Poribacteria bacterium]|nr:hypothetical protein [Candidatus Poribacteria bacterium]